MINVTEYKNEHIGVLDEYALFNADATVNGRLTGETYKTKTQPTGLNVITDENDRIIDTLLEVEDAVEVDLTDDINAAYAELIDGDETDVDAKYLLVKEDIIPIETFDKVEAGMVVKTDPRVTVVKKENKL